MQRIQNFFKKKQNVAFATALIVGLIVHIFGLVNTMHNYDDIAVLPSGFGSSINSGRWLLAILGGAFHLLFGTYNLPFFNGALFILIIAVCAGYLTALFDVENPKLAALLGAILAVFPGTTTTLFFKYTAPYYAIAILLAILAAKVLFEAKRGPLISGIHGALLVMLSLGIYQAYLPITVSILVVCLLLQALRDKTVGFRSVVLRGLGYCVSIIVGIILYRIIVDGAIYLCNRCMDIIYAQAPDATVTRFALSDYQGINTMGNLTFAQLGTTVWVAFKSLFILPLQDYHGFAQTLLLRVGYGIIGLLSVAVIAIGVGQSKRTVGNIASIVLLCLLYPIAVCLVEIMCPNSFVYTLMVFSFFLVPLTPLLLCELVSVNANSGKKLLIFAKKAVFVTVSILVLAYAHGANVNYLRMYFTTRQTENYMSSLVTQIRMTKGFKTDQKWALIGEINDPLLNGRWQRVDTYGGNVTINNLLNQYSRNNWISNYVGYTVNYANADEIAVIEATAEFKEMPHWPNEGSVRIINDMVVVKF